MKALLAVWLFCISTVAAAIPIYTTVPINATVVQEEGSTLVGYQRIQTGRYWTWHGKARKYTYVPVYTVSAVPEPVHYALFAVGLGFVGARVVYSRRGQQRKGGA